MQSRLIYWLSFETTEFHLQKKNELEQRGYHVEMFCDLKSLLHQVSLKRVGYFILSDEADDHLILDAIAVLSSHPEIFGAKMVMTISRVHEAVTQSAVHHGFRDLLWIDLGVSEWVQRFLVSIGTKTVEIPTPRPLTLCDEDLVLYIPARISWVGAQKVVLESRLKLSPGMTVELNGAIVEALGHKSLPITIEEPQPMGLRYHFSSALVAKWSDQETFNTAAGSTLLQDFSRFNSTVKPRIFLIIQSPALRMSILKHLDTGRFEIHTALQKRSMVEDPKFFVPHITFIEERLCVSENLSRFAQMVQSLPHESVIVVIGSDSHRSALEGVANGRKIHFLRNVPLNLREYVDKHFISSAVKTECVAGCFAPPLEHPFTFAELKLSCKLGALHPLMVQLHFFYKIGKYGVMRLVSPYLREIIGRDPYVKLMHIHETNNPLSGNQFDADGYFCDLSPEERQKIATVLFKS